MIFDKFIRFYIKYFILIIITLFITTEIFDYIYILPVVIFLLVLNFLILIIAYIYHSRLNRLIKDDINKRIIVVKTNNVNEFKDLISIISLFPSEIPKDIVTQDPTARLVFSEFKKLEFLHCITRTFHSKNYYRYDWLKIDKNKNLNLIDKLIIGDQMLYHKKKSYIGSIIRFFLRSYWEHVAIYVGDGFVVEAVPRGVIKTHLSTWIESNDIDIGVLRTPLKKIKNEEDMKSFAEKQVGKKYNYLGVLKIFWMIITNKLCDGLINPLVLLVNLILIFFASLFCYEHSDMIRVHLLIILLISPYLFSSIYHWIAYNSNLVKMLKVQNEKP